MALVYYELYNVPSIFGYQFQINRMNNINNVNC
jgi:hypothetical protein